MPCLPHKLFTSLGSPVKKLLIFYYLFLLLFKSQHNEHLQNKKMHIILYRSSSPHISQNHKKYSDSTRFIAHNADKKRYAYKAGKYSHAQPPYKTHICRSFISQSYGLSDLIDTNKSNYFPI